MSESHSRAESEHWVGFMGAQPILMEMEYIRSHDLESLIIPNDVRRRQLHLFDNRSFFHPGMCNGDFWDEGSDEYDDLHPSPSPDLEAPQEHDGVPLHYVLQIRNILRSGQLIE